MSTDQTKRTGKVGGIEVPISNQKYLVGIVDEDDYERVSSMKWHLTHNGYMRGQLPKSKKKVFLQRYILGEIPNGMEIDHINRNKLDNRKENLRIITRSKNHANKSVPKNNKTGYKGVIYYWRTGQYRASIGVNNKKIYIGYYSTAEEAARAYNRAALNYFGEIAYLNPVD